MTEPNTAPDRDEGRTQRRSAVVLKRRVIDEERTVLASALDWARDEESFERVAAMIVAARRRFILGAAKSFAYASLLAMDLSAGLANVTLIDGTIVRPLDVLSDVRSSDVLVVISLARYRRYTIEMALLFAEAGGTLVVITDDAAAPLVAHATESLIVPRGGGSAFAHSPTSVALVIHLLATLTTASAKGAGRRKIERDRLSTVLDLYRDD